MSKIYTQHIKTCNTCPHYREHVYGYKLPIEDPWCSAIHRTLGKNNGFTIHNIPDWCPLEDWDIT